MFALGPDHYDPFSLSSLYHERWMMANHFICSLKRALFLIWPPPESTRAKIIFSQMNSMKSCDCEHNTNTCSSGQMSLICNAIRLVLCLFSFSAQYEVSVHCPFFANGFPSFLKALTRARLQNYTNARNDVDNHNNIGANTRRRPRVAKNLCETRDRWSNYCNHIV